jgi:hypothetical protein
LVFSIPFCALSSASLRASIKDFDKFALSQSDSTAGWNASIKATDGRFKVGYRARRLMGDMAVLGKGEMLILA